MSHTVCAAAYTYTCVCVRVRTSHKRDTIQLISPLSSPRYISYLLLLLLFRYIHSACVRLLARLIPESNASRRDRLPIYYTHVVIYMCTANDDPAAASSDDGRSAYYYHRIVRIHIYCNICDVCTALYKLLSRVRDENNRRPDVSVYTYA